MTALLAPTAASPWSIGAPRLLAGLDRLERLDAAAHRAVHGPRPGLDLDRLLALLDASGLAGRGGAGFPLAAKLRALEPGRRTVVVNASESEPASQKDRVLLRRSPHLVIDGALTVASAIGARRVTVAVHDTAAGDAVRAALRERPDGAPVDVRSTGGRFVAGEARAVVRALHGGPARPPGRRDHLSGRGTVLANVETFAQLAVLIRLGARRFADTGTRHEPGTVLLTVGGAVARPGVVEIPLGTPLGIVLPAAGAADPQAIVTGGYHGSWLAPIAAIRLSREGLAAAGGTLGSGVLLVLDHGTCALGELSAVTSWLAGESSGQCGPCRFGLPALAADVHAVCAGQRAALGRALDHARAVDGRGACSHPDGTARFVTTALQVLAEEVDVHRRRGGCGRPVLGRLPIGGAS